MEKRRFNELSIKYYNRGLYKCEVRDLTGAIRDLKISLKLNKANMEARNLLGLIYYEIGEYSLGMVQWILSMNMKGKDNKAIEYLEEVQKDDRESRAIIKAIKEYNRAIDYINSGALDLGIISLKHSIDANPKLLRTKLLLSLMYINNSQYGKAREIIKSILSVDKGNTRALLYLNETKKKESSPLDEDNKEVKIVEYKNGTETIIKENKQNKGYNRGSIRRKILLWVFSTIGIMWFLVVPFKVKNEIEANQKDIIKYQKELESLRESISEKEVYIKELENYKEEEEKKKEEENKENNE